MRDFMDKAADLWGTADNDKTPSGMPVLTEAKGMRRIIPVLPVVLLACEQNTC